jgi:LysR family transcriptional regulator of gallate degradation
MTIASLNLRHLAALAAAVRHGSVSRAAHSVGISQPAVTQGIARLEEATGTQLLHRSANGVTATDGGVLLGSRAEAAAAAIAGAFRPFRSGGSGGRAGAERDISMAQLQALIGLADAGSYAAGARLVGISQPSLHRSVAELERIAGVALVQRQGRGVALTESGQRMAAAFRLAAAELQAALDELAVLAGRDQGTIRIIAHDAALAQLLPRTIARFLAEHPPVTVELLPSGNDDLSRLRSGQVDALVILRDSVAENETAAAETLVAEPLVVAGRPGHPLAQAPSTGLSALASHGWAVQTKGELRDAWERLFLDRGVYPPVPNVTCAGSAALLSLAAESDLLTVAPLRLASGTLVAIGAPVGRRDIVLVTRAGWVPTPAQATFVEDLRQCAQEVLRF